MSLRGGWCLAAALLAACARGSTPGSLGDDGAALVPERARTAHVVLVSVDGLRPDAIDSTGAPTLLRLRREGAHAVEARTITPSVTLPSHASMISGVEPAVHGITWNSWQLDRRGPITVPTMFSVAHDAGRHTALVASKAKFAHLERPGSLDAHAWPPPAADLWPWREAVQEAGRIVRADTAVGILMVHLAECDVAGHTSGWMSAPYREAVLSADSAVAAIAAMADSAWGAGRWTLIVSADHGGHGKLHGSTADADVRIPWIAWGAGVRRGDIPVIVRTTDTAPTVVWLLGLAPPRSWTGRVVRGALAALPAAAASSAATPAASPAP